MQPDNIPTLIPWKSVFLPPNISHPHLCFGWNFLRFALFKNVNSSRDSSTCLARINTTCKTTSMTLTNHFYLDNFLNGPATTQKLCAIDSTLFHNKYSPPWGSQYDFKDSVIFKHVYC